MSVVDTHVHVVAGDEARYPLDPLDDAVRWFRDAPCPIEWFQSLMETHDVARAFLVQAMGAYSADNSYVVDAAARDPRRLCAVVYVDATAPDATGTLDRWVARGARGVRVVPRTEAGTGFDDPRVVALVEHATALGLHVLASMRGDGLGSLGALLARAPELRVAVDHCGFPDLTGGHPYPAAADLFALAPYPSVVLKLSTIALVRASRADGGDPAPFAETLVERFGPDRCMWASNYSQTDDLTYAEMLDLADRATRRLATPERNAFFSGTALAQWPA